jgi:glycosyltransferase involved in cell wall biosynthesis
MVEQYKPLVSILIAAYNPKFFSLSLASALNQSYEETEILIGDDSGKEFIGEIVAAFAEHKNFHKIRLHRNEKNLGFRLNFIKLVNLAQGEFIKFLNDDDLLDNQCIESMIRYFWMYQDRLTLVTSKRNVIDHLGGSLPDTVSTVSVSNWTKSPLIEGEYFYLNGKDLGNIMLTSMINMVGEPTTVLFRRSDLEGIRPDIFSISNNPAQGNVDVALWLNLLSKGDAVYIDRPLSLFRAHPAQEQQNANVLFHCYVDWYNAIEDAAKLGFLADRASLEKAAFTVKENLDQCVERISFSKEQKAHLRRLARKLRPSTLSVWRGWPERVGAWLKSGT